MTIQDLHSKCSWALFSYTRPGRILRELGIKMCCPVLPMTASGSNQRKCFVSNWHPFPSIPIQRFKHSLKIRTKHGHGDLWKTTLLSSSCCFPYMKAENTSKNNTYTSKEAVKINISKACPVWITGDQRGGNHSRPLCYLARGDISVLAHANLFLPTGASDSFRARMYCFWRPV